MQTTFIKLGSAHIRCEIADTPSAHSLGLSKHASLEDDEGMLFVFDRPRTCTFWMSSVRFPIDIVGIDEHGRVAKIVSNAQPGTFEHWTFPKVAAVLEVVGGMCERERVSTGSVVEEFSSRTAQADTRTF